LAEQEEPRVLITVDNVAGAGALREVAVRLPRRPACATNALLVFYARAHGADVTALARIFGADLPPDQQEELTAILAS